MASDRMAHSPTVNLSSFGRPHRESLEMAYEMSPHVVAVFLHRVFFCRTGRFSLPR